MDTLPDGVKVLKALVAPARHSDGPTLYLICQQEKTGHWQIHEHLPDGQCLVWPENPAGPQQAEAKIYGWKSTAGSEIAHVPEARPPDPTLAPLLPLGAVEPDSENARQA